MISKILQSTYVYKFFIKVCESATMLHIYICMWVYICIFMCKPLYKYIEKRKVTCIDHTLLGKKEAFEEWTKTLFTGCNPLRPEHNPMYKSDDASLWVFKLLQWSNDDPHLHAYHMYSYKSSGFWYQRDWSEIIVLKRILQEMDLIRE